MRLLSTKRNEVPVPGGEKAVDKPLFVTFLSQNAGLTEECERIREGWESDVR